MVVSKSRHLTWGQILTPQQFISYPGGIFSGIIVASVNKDSTTISSIAWAFCLACFSIPGTLGGAYCAKFVDRRIQLGLGFLGYCVFGIAIGAAYEKVTKIIPLFIVLYGIYLSCGSEYISASLCHSQGRQDLATDLSSIWPR